MGMGYDGNFLKKNNSARTVIDSSWCSALVFGGGIIRSGGDCGKLKSNDQDCPIDCCHIGMGARLSRSLSFYEKPDIQLFMLNLLIFYCWQVM